MGYFLGQHNPSNYFALTMREQQEEGTRRGSERVRAVYCRNAKREKDDAGRACGKDSCDG